MPHFSDLPWELQEEIWNHLKSESAFAHCGVVCRRSEYARLFQRARSAQVTLFDESRTSGEGVTLRSTLRALTAKDKAASQFAIAALDKVVNTKCHKTVRAFFRRASFADLYYGIYIMATKGRATTLERYLRSLVGMIALSADIVREADARTRFHFVLDLALPLRTRLLTSTVDPRVSMRAHFRTLVRARARAWRQWQRVRDAHHLRCVLTWWAAKPRL